MKQMEGKIIVNPDNNKQLILNFNDKLFVVFSESDVAQMILLLMAAQKKVENN